MYFKVLNNNGAGIYSRTSWTLPRQAPAKRGQDGTWLPGRWMPEIKRLVVCESGYHLTDEAHLVEWLGPAIYVAEGRGEFLVDGDKTVFAQVRLLRRLDTWNAKAARLFAADVTEHVLPLFEAKFPTDTRPREAIAVARRFANGLATEGKLKAARDAVRAAANTAYIAADSAYAIDDAVCAAVDAAAYVADAAAHAVYVITHGTYFAADSAVYAAVRAAYAAYAAGNVAERKWQTTKLMEYLFPK